MASFRRFLAKNLGQNPWAIPREAISHKVLGALSGKRILLLHESMPYKGSVISTRKYYGNIVSICNMRQIA